MVRVRAGRIDRFLGAHAERLHAPRADADRAARIAGLVGIDGQVIHAHRILFGHRRCVRQAHWIAVVENAAFGGAVSARRAGGRRGGSSKTGT